jgi:signal transduction histidine kinase
LSAPPSSAGLTIRALLVVGFGLTFGIWLLAWYSFSRDIVQLEEQAHDVSARYLRAQEQISATRADVYRASILARDALLGPTPPTVADRDELAAAYASADKTLAGYEPVQLRDGRDRVERLRDEIDALRRAMTSLVVPGDAGGWAASDRRSLLAAIRPRRDAAIRIADELQGLNRNDFLQHQRSTTTLYRDTQERFSNSLALALLASLGIAVFAGTQVTRLERRLLVQRAQDLQNQQDLQRLSAKLIHAQEEERRSIARELHDEVGQVLTAIKVELAVAQHTLSAAGEPVTVLADARVITDRALHTVRDLSRLLHPALLDDIGLPAALDWYIKGYRKRHGLAVEYEVQGIDDRLAPDIEASVYRIVQEGLTNVVRHAATSSCVVRLVHAEGVLMVTVADDGVGFDPQAPSRDRTDQGLGLIGIRERAWHLGGTVTLTSAVGRGTTLFIVVPTRLRAPATASLDATSVGASSIDLERTAEVFH